MKYYGTKNNKDYGFYEENFENAIEITDEYWMQLLNEQSEGKRIILFDNSVVAVDETEYSQINGVWTKLGELEIREKQLKIQNAIRMQEIQDELDRLDKKRIRAMAEPSLMDADTSWLEHYNKQVKNLREELEQLNK